ncbi:hypothetical protein C0Q70_07308 [Pomacea canaliculata]|uniref:Gamma-interferon-inducible lysosomal thiol reductase n=1 Tax=Pomacea canaliculata TaxID=400727 RepID=A0A2T7PEP6_POMCA|nr:hypothetical protein C0Q70_07308 [Pomacea canaliculata]
MNTVLLLALISPAVASVCRFPPSLWCSSEEIAEQCKDFIEGQLYPTFQKVGNIMNLTLIPYGNAKEQKGPQGEYIFTCQHGELECIGNTIETCAIYELKNISIYFPFIHCMELSLRSYNPYEAASVCSNKTGVPVQNILNCANSSLGNTLEHQMALKTDALQPSHEYVPWVTLNGVHTEKINNKAVKNLLKLICETYKGPKPEPCKEELLPSSKRCFAP